MNADIKERMLMDLIREDVYLSSPIIDADNENSISNDDTALSEAFEAYKFALENLY